MNYLDLPKFSWHTNSIQKLNIAFPNGDETINEEIDLIQDLEELPACVFQGSTDATHLIISSSSSSRSCQSLDQHVEISLNSTLLKSNGTQYYSIYDGQLSDITEIIFEPNYNQNMRRRKKRATDLEKIEHDETKIEIKLQFA